MERIPPPLFVGLVILALIAIWFGPNVIDLLSSKAKTKSDPRLAVSMESNAAGAASEPIASVDDQGMAPHDPDLASVYQLLTNAGINVISMGRSTAHINIRVSNGSEVPPAKRVVCGNRRVLQRLSQAGLTTMAIGARGDRPKTGFRTDASIESAGTCGNNWRERWEESR
jgi:hypothetical protein